MQEEIKQHLTSVCNLNSTAKQFLSGDMASLDGSSIEYVSPGEVRSGATFYLVYHRNDLRFDFCGEGIWSAKNCLVGYEVKIPRELRDSQMRLVDKEVIVERVREYVQSSDFVWHKNVSVESL